MTQIEKIKLFLKGLCGHLSISFVRADQSGDRPEYIFMSYKILSSDPEPAQGIIEEQEFIQDDETKILKTSIRESELVVSLSFIGSEDDYASLWAFAEEAIDWVDSIFGSDKADEIGIGVSSVSPVQDRSVFFETEYEHKLGFDIRIKNKQSKEQTVDTVDLSATISEITYN